MNQYAILLVIKGSRQRYDNQGTKTIGNDDQSIKLKQLCILCLLSSYITDYRMFIYYVNYIILILIQHLMAYTSRAGVENKLAKLFPDVA